MLKYTIYKPGSDNFFDFRITSHIIEKKVSHPSHKGETDRSVKLKLN